MERIETNNVPYRVLVVEDDHLAEGKEIYDKLYSQICTFRYASTLKEYEQKIQDETPDGIITDCFFPAGYDKQTNIKKGKGLFSRFKLLLDKDIEDLEKNKDFYGNEYALNKERQNAFSNILSEWIQGQNLASGIFVMEQASRMKIPIVLHSDTHHHGHKGEYIQKWFNENMKKLDMRIPYIECLRREPPDLIERGVTKKRWYASLDRLLPAMVAKRDYGIETSYEIGYSNLVWPTSDKGKDIPFESIRTKTQKLLKDMLGNELTKLDKNDFERGLGWNLIEEINSQ